MAGRCRAARREDSSSSAWRVRLLYFVLKLTSSKSECRAFAIGSAHPSDTTASLPRGLLKHSEELLRVFAADYRLCAHNEPMNPFPTAVLDSIAGYRHLLRMGFLPQNITIAGE